MEPVTIAILFVSSVLAVAFWPWIVDFFSTTVIPWVRSNVSSMVGSWLADVLAIADGAITPIRRTVKTLWKYFKHTFLGCKVEFTKTSAITAVGKTVTTVRDENGKVMQSTITEELSWEDLPEPIRSEMTRQNKNTAQMDLKEVVETKYRAVAQKNGMEMELTT